MGEEVVKQGKRSKESPVSTVSVILERIHPLGDGRLVGQKVAKGGRCCTQRADPSIFPSYVFPLWRGDKRTEQRKPHFWEALL